MKITAVIAAGGKGERMGANINKVFLSVLGREVLAHTISAFSDNEQIDEIIIVTAKRDMDRCRKIADRYKKVTCVTEGGDTRQKSVIAGLCKATGDIVLIHDGARALVSDMEINAVIADCERYGAAAAGVQCKDTLKTADNDGFIKGTIDRETTYLIQTPQAFYLNEITELHKRAEKDGFIATDDCMIAERYGRRVKITEGSYDNIKLTTPEDMIIAEGILKRRMK